LFSFEWLFVFDLNEKVGWVHLRRTADGENRTATLTGTDPIFSSKELFSLARHVAQAVLNVKVQF